MSNIAHLSKSRSSEFPRQKHHPQQHHHYHHPQYHNHHQNTHHASATSTSFLPLVDYDLPHPQRPGSAVYFPHRSSASIPQDTALFNTLLSMDESPPPFKVAPYSPAASIHSLSDEQRLEKALENDFNCLSGGVGNRSREDSIDSLNDFAASFSSARPVTSRMTISRPKTASVSRGNRSNSTADSGPVVSQQISSSTTSQEIEAGRGGGGGKFHFQPLLLTTTTTKMTTTTDTASIATSVLSSTETRRESRPYMAAFLNGLLTTAGRDIGVAMSTKLNNAVDVDASSNHDSEVASITTEERGSFRPDCSFAAVKVPPTDWTEEGGVGGLVDSKEDTRCYRLCRGCFCGYCAKSERHSNVVENHKLARLVTLGTLITIIGLVIVYILKTEE